MGSRFLTFNLRETDTYLLIGKALKTSFGLPQDTLFFEVPMGSSRADILHVQTRNDSLLRPGIHVFEVKMARDSDAQRLRRQLRDYLSCADHVWVVGVNAKPDLRRECVGGMVFSTNGCAIEVVRNSGHNTHIDRQRRQLLLSDLAGRLRDKYRSVEEMSWVCPDGDGRFCFQEKIGAY